MDYAAFCFRARTHLQHLHTTGTKTISSFFSVKLPSDIEGYFIPGADYAVGGGVGDFREREEYVVGTGGAADETAPRSAREVPTRNIESEAKVAILLELVYKGRGVGIAFVSTRAERALTRSSSRNGPSLLSPVRGR